MVDTADPLACFEAQLPPELGSVVAARHLVEAAARAWDLSDSVTKDSALTASELVTNAVLHAGSSVSISVKRLGRGLRIEVCDGSSRLPVVDADRPEDLLANRSMTGRGLTVVAATADRWGADRLPGGGKMTWAEVGTGRRRVASAPPPAFPPTPKPVKLTSSALAAGVTSATAVTGGGRRVQLIGVPVQLLVESTQHFADLEREIRVMAMDHHRPAELEGVLKAGREISAEIDPWTRVDRTLVDAAVARGDDRLDYEVVVSPDAADVFDRLALWLNRIRSTLLTRRPFLTTPPSDEVTTYRAWYREEIRSQLAGRPPRPCPLKAPKA